MSRAIIFCLGLALVMVAADSADAWRGAVGPRGGGFVDGPRGVAARGPGGGAVAVGRYGGAAVRGPGGNVAVRGGYGGAYYGGRLGYGYGAGAVAAGVAVGAAAGAAAAYSYPAYSCYPYYCQ